MTTATPEATGPGRDAALRERRRRQTEREIGDAALDLFERHGVDHTTVDDIARAAGVSPRTVFRYFPTKEGAALVPHVELEERVEAMLDGFDAALPLVDQLEAVWREVLLALDDGRSEAGRLVLRVRRLMRTEPGLRLVALGLDEERADALVARLAALTGAADELAARLAVETTALGVRVALDRWADARETGADPAAGLVATYDEVCRVLRALVG